MMDAVTLKKANELQEKIKEIDSFIYYYNLTWKRGFIKRESKLVIGHHGYGYFSSGEMDCDKELSELIYKALLEYQGKLHNEFKELEVFSE